LRLLLIMSGLALALACRGTGHIDSHVASGDGFVLGDGGIRLYYRALGQGGDTVVVLHGSPGYHMNYLLPNLAPLARGRTLLFYDQRGGGRSELLTDPALLTLEYHVRDLEALRRHFGLQRISLLGHSWGGGLAALYAMAHPDRVDRMLLLAPMTPRRDPYFNRTTDVFRARLDSATWARARALEQHVPASHDPVATCRELMAVVLAAPLYFKDQTAARQFRGDFCDAPPEALRNVRFTREAFTKSRGDWDLRTGLTRLRIPTLVLHGTRDAIPLEAADEWVRSLPNARLLVIPDADHYLFADRANIVLPAIDRFLRGYWPASTERPEHDAAHWSERRLTMGELSCWRFGRAAP
jgi:proline iminopeptidase